MNNLSIASCVLLPGVVVPLLGLLVHVLPELVVRSLHFGVVVRVPVSRRRVVVVRGLLPSVSVGLLFRFGLGRCRLVVVPVELPQNQSQKPIFLIESGLALIDCPVVGQLVPHRPLVLNGSFLLIGFVKSLVIRNQPVLVCCFKSPQYLILVCPYW